MLQHERVPQVTLNPCVHMSLSARSILMGFGAVALLGATFALGARVGAMRERDRDDWTEGRLLSTAIDSVHSAALDSLPTEELVRRAVSGMLRELHDPYAALLRADGYKRYRGALHGEGDGMGLSLRSQAGVVNVARVADGSPAASAGIRRGDRVLSVNGIPIAEGIGRHAGDTTSASLDSARVLLLRAPAGDTVTVGLQRRQWHETAVSDAAILGDSVGYVRLTSMTTRSAEELERAVGTLQLHGAKSLLLDLRGNGGGLFEEGVRAAGLFLPRGALVASLAGRNGKPLEAHRAPKSRWPTLPLTLLVDGGTASAAEVMAAALREHDRALLVGSPTYGKGLVQRVVRLTPDLSLRLTTARWLTPSGKALERRQGSGATARGGMLPDVLLDDATRADPFALPREWSSNVATAIARAADSLALLALRERWTLSPIALLEARLRLGASGTQFVGVLSELPRTDWVNIATRLATARVLELAQQNDELLRYGVRTDAALRAGLDLLAPGADVSHVLPSVLPPVLPPMTPARPAGRVLRATR